MTSFSFFFGLKEVSSSLPDSQWGAYCSNKNITIITKTTPQLSNLVDILEMHVEDLSSYSIYAQEVHSSMLEWSPPHTSEKFWRENMKAFENDNYAAIKELAKMIAISKEPLNIQV